VVRGRERECRDHHGSSQAPMGVPTMTE
jgi:hypothetical protein